jgi:ribosomal protein S18 acetylase RimI-like enzyme
MNYPASSIAVSVATEATQELVTAFATLVPQLSATATPPDADTLAKIIASPSNAILLARDQGKGGAIVGVLTLVTFRIPTALRAWIEDVVVDSSARGRGVGEQLTREALRVAWARGAQSVDLTSRHSREAAHRLYQRVGFVPRDTTVYRYVRKEC